MNKIRQAEFPIWVVLILLLNLPLLLTGQPALDLCFDAPAIAGGEPWRLFTHPFIHVSFYHLLLDAGAFLLLYRMLETTRLRQRLGYTLACAAGSLLGVLLLQPEALARAGGFCGLSGIAHGLMGISAAEWMRHEDPVERRAGWICLILVGGKSLIELFSGAAFLGGLHLGNVGQPLTACHFGGLLAGLVAYQALSINRKLVRKHPGAPAPSPAQAATGKATMATWASGGAGGPECCAPALQRK